MINFTAHTNTTLKQTISLKIGHKNIFTFESWQEKTAYKSSNLTYINPSKSLSPVLIKLYLYRQCEHILFNEFKDSLA